MRKRHCRIGRHGRLGSHWVPCESARRGITGVRARIHIRSAAVRIPGLVAKLQQKALVAVVSTILGEVTQNDVAVIALVLQAGLLEVEEKSVGDLRDGIHCAPFVAVSGAGASGSHRFSVLQQLVATVAGANLVKTMLRVKIVGTETVHS